ncbi:MAG: sialate O-acetylesterase, partial [Bacteroidetes bacterium]|nr:sialate O-acetylesterase [Bacteroidota bacterium]
YRSMEVQGDAVLLSFSEEIVVRGAGVRELWVAGEDRVFYPATGKVKGDKMVVSAKEVKKPVAVRYQFSNSGIGNLFGKQGLPVAPFRTDSWTVF